MVGSRLPTRRARLFHRMKRLSNSAGVFTNAVIFGATTPALMRSGSPGRHPRRVVRLSEESSNVFRQNARRRGWSPSSPFRRRLPWARRSRRRTRRPKGKWRCRANPAGNDAHGRRAPRNQSHPLKARPCFLRRCGKRFADSSRPGAGSGARGQHLGDQWSGPRHAGQPRYESTVSRCLTPAREPLRRVIDESRARLFRLMRRGVVGGLLQQRTPMAFSRLFITAGGGSLIACSAWGLPAPRPRPPRRRPRPRLRPRFRRPRTSCPTAISSRPCRVG